MPKPKDDAEVVTHRVMLSEDVEQALINYLDLQSAAMKEALGLLAVFAPIAIKLTQQAVVEGIPVAPAPAAPAAPSIPAAPTNLVPFPPPPSAVAPAAAAAPAAPAAPGDPSAPVPPAVETPTRPARPTSSRRR
jgi:hypothetical protein